MAAELLTDASRATDSNSNPYAGATWSFYAAGTLTPQNVYADADLSTSLGAVVTADAGGKFVPIYFDSALKYRGILKSADGATTIYDIDPINTGVMSELGAPDGSSVIGFIQSGSGAVARPVQDELRETVKVTQFTGANDVAKLNAAFTSHPGRAIHAPRLATPYQITELVVIPDDTTLVFECGARCELAYNGPAFKLGQNSHIWFLDLEGNGATYAAGKGVVIDGTDGKNGLIQPKIWNTGSYCIDFLAKTAGSGFKANNLNLARYDAVGPAAVNETRTVINIITDGTVVEATPRTFSNLSTNGWATINTGSCNGLVITGGDYWGPFYFNDNSRGVTIGGGRWGNQTTCNIKGANITIADCDIAPALTITASDGIGSGQSITIESNSMNNPRIIDNSGYPQTNRLSHRAVSDATNLVLKADGTALTVTAGNNRNAVYRNGIDYCLDIDIQGSWQGGVAIPGGLGATSTLTIDVPADYMPKYEQFVGPIQMTYNGAQIAVYGRLFGTTTGAGNLLRLGTLSATGTFTNITGGAYNAGPVTRLRGTFRWTRGEL